MARFKVGDYVRVIPVSELTPFDWTFPYCGIGRHYNINDSSIDSMAGCGGLMVKHVYDRDGYTDYKVDGYGYKLHEEMLSPAVKQDIQLKSECMDDFISMFCVKDCT